MQEKNLLDVVFVYQCNAFFNLQTDMLWNDSKYHLFSELLPEI